MTKTATIEDAEKKKPPRDATREVVETIVFVVVLVLLLKLFITEAFVIPTGSMAETLYGYQSNITCPQCGHKFPVNSHDQVELNAQTGQRHPLTGYCCPNCRHVGMVRELNPVPSPETGDRVLVLKPLYHLRSPQRGDVVVFKFPEAPQDKHTAQNYIKRAMGFGGETVAIYRGELYVTTALAYPEQMLDATGRPLFPRPADPHDLWKGDPIKGPDYRYPNSPHAVELFEKSRAAGFTANVDGGFRVVRKGEAQVLADRRIVWDNDRQPKDLAGLARARWYAEASGKWNADHPQQPRVFIHTGDGLDWLRYRHLVWTQTLSSTPHLMPWRWPPDPRDDFRKVIDDVLAMEPAPLFTRPNHLTINPDIDTAGEQNRKNALYQAHIATPLTLFAGSVAVLDGVFTYCAPVAGPVDNMLGYNQGKDRWPNGKDQSRDTSQETLWVGDLILECEVQISDGAEVVLELSKGVNRFQAKFGGGQVTLSRLGPLGPEFGNPSRACKVKNGTYKLRFANVDARLMVWVDGKRIDFTEGDRDLGDYNPAEADHYEPEDTLREGWVRANDIDAPAGIGAKGQVQVQAVKLYRDVYYTRSSAGDQSGADIYYVHPGHYLCLGDNSAQSSDSRKWGVVPERLMLGKAVFVFWPIGRVGFIK